MATNKELTARVAELVGEVKDWKNGAQIDEEEFQDLCGSESIRPSTCCAPKYCRLAPFHEVTLLRKELSRAEATLASRNSMLDRLNASNERLTAENGALKLRLQRICEPVSDEEWHNLWDAQMLCGMIGTEATTREGADMIIAARAAKE